MAETQDKQANTWGMMCHLLSLCGLIGIPLGNIIAPLIVWLIKKDEFPFVMEQGKESLNFQISMTIYAIVAAMLCMIFIGFILLAAIAIADLILVIDASMKANKGVGYHYPATIRLIK
ncbi:MAG: DUF4870 domain-containing protein [Candidatus Omnitrophota bacterium]